LRDQIIADLKQILKKDLFVDLDLSKVSEDDGLQSVVGLDSVGFVELRIACEEHFKIEISDEQFSPVNFRCLAGLADLVAELHNGFRR
jgi:acyl carrier protein